MIAFDNIIDAITNFNNSYFSSGVKLNVCA